MNAKQLNEYFEHPERMDEASLLALKQAVQDFPFAAALQVLLMKALQNKDSYQLPAQVKRAAIAVPDRKALKAFYELKSNEVIPVIEFDLDALKAQKQKAAKQTVKTELPEKHAEPVQTSPAEESKPSKKPAPSSSPEPPKISSKEPVKKIDPVVNENSKPDMVASKETSKKVEVASEKKDDLSHLPESVRKAILRSRALQKGNKASQNPVEQQQESVREKVADEHVLENASAKTEVQEPSEHPKEVAPIPAPKREVEIPSEELPAKEEVEEDGKEEDLRVMPFSEKASFLDWLNADVEVHVAPIDSSQPFASFEVVPEESEEQEEDFAEEESPNEIRRIIQDLPKFSGQGRGENINVFNLEANEEGRFVTETLAEIYFQQRLFAKAIKSYEILSLKYPEKSGFFADRIRAIKKEKNS